MIVEHQKVNPVMISPGIERSILASGGRLMAVEAQFQKGAAGAVHSHPHEQISYIIRGSFEFELNGQKMVIREGDSYYVGPGIPHGVTALEDSIILDVFTPQREDFL